MKLSGVSQKVFLDRYALKNKAGAPLEKTPEEMWKRVAKAVAAVEKKDKQKFWEKEFFWAMKDFKYVPGGRILAGAGAGFAVTYYNCFVLPSPADSRDGILETLKQMVEIMARGGGVGINLSSLRPRGARVKKVNGFSSGPCNWAELFSVATKDIIQQGGTRRGALILMLWDWHPDIEEFITVKQDLSRINGANLSVCVSDKFMEAVEKDADWPLVFPQTSDPKYDEKWDGDLEVWKKLGKKVVVHKVVKARKIWDLIAEAAWRSAEPGVVFMERYNKLHNNYYWNRINCVNPCVTGDTLVTTEKGQKKAKDLRVGDKILTPKGFKKIAKIYNNGLQKIYRVSFSDGGHLEATADHRLKVVRNGSFQWKKVSDLKKGDEVLKLFSFRTVNQSRQSQKKESNQNQKNNNHHQIIGIDTGNVHPYTFAFLAKVKLINQETELINIHNNTPIQSTLSMPATSGGKTAKAKITCPTSAVISDNFLTSQTVNKGLSKNNVRETFTDFIIHKNGYQYRYGVAKIISVQDTGKMEEVFDVYEPETLTWVTNDYVSLDCGEEGLPPWGVCNLGSINLSALVKSSSINKPGKFDFSLLKKVVRIATRFQDNVVDMDPYIFPEIRKIQYEGERRIGLGTMGLGDALIKLHLRYGSEKSLKFIDGVYKIIRDEAYATSVETAKEKGSFPKFDRQLYPKSKFIQELPKNLQKEIKKYGIRNSLLLMQAPTGSTSLMAGTTSGIEPVFEFEFVRRDRLGEHVIRHHLYEQWQKKHLKEKRSDWFVSANDLTPQDHVMVQAAIQKYVDASISKTVNAPKNHTVADVKNLYRLAYKFGLKGITYMREGSRAGVLERLGEKPPREKSKIPDYKIKPRPMVVHGSTYRINTPVGSAFITINTNGGTPPEPLEVFITVGKAGTDVYAMAEGLGRMISLALRFSSHLPVNERIQEIIDQLQDIGGARSLGFGKDKIRSLPDAVAKILMMHYGKNGEEKKTNGNGELITETSQPSLIQASPSMATFDICPSCGEASLVHEEGCKKCYGCGYSEC